jgi:hypothetical protein
MSFTFFPCKKQMGKKRERVRMREGAHRRKGGRDERPEKVREAGKRPPLEKMLLEENLFDIGN